MKFLPPVPYIFILLLGFFSVVFLLWKIRPEISDEMILSFTPWMILGSSFYVLYQIDAFPELISYFFGPVSVYITTFIFSSIVWIIITLYKNPEISVSRGVKIVGILTDLTVIGIIFLKSDIVNIIWPSIGILLSVAFTVIVWSLIKFLNYYIEIYSGKLGIFVIFSHILDGISTTIGTDIFGFKEQNLVSRFIIDIANSYPISQIPGQGWLFILIKIFLSIFVLWALADYKLEKSKQRSIILGFIGAVGFGPGVYNLILYSISL